MYNLNRIIVIIFKCTHACAWGYTLIFSNTRVQTLFPPHTWIVDSSMNLIGRTNYYVKWKYKNNTLLLPS